MLLKIVDPVHCEDFTMEMIRLVGGPRDGDRVVNVPQGYTLVRAAAECPAGPAAIWSDALETFEKLRRKAQAATEDTA